MATCFVRNWDGKEHGTAEVNLAVAKENVASHIVHRALRCQLANSRQGTASTRTRSEVRGGGRKPWKQKGTGRARAGSIRSPLWRGGGVAFGPKPRDYSVKMNRKEWRLAIRTAFQSRLADIVIIETIEPFLTKPKTKEFVEASKRWDIDLNRETLLFILPVENQKNTYLSVRNLPGVKVVNAQNLNILDILDKDRILITKDALALICILYGEDYRRERRLKTKRNSTRKSGIKNKYKINDTSLHLNEILLKHEMKPSEASMQDIKMNFPDKVEVNKVYDLEIALVNSEVVEENLVADAKLEIVVAVSPLDFTVKGSDIKSIKVGEGIISTTFQLIPKRKGNSQSIKVNFLRGSRYLGRGELSVFVN